MKLLTNTFDYYLPKELIAQEPLSKRDHSRLLIYKRDTNNTEHDKFYNLLHYINKGDVIVFNDTRVMPARLIGKREKYGSKVEVFLLNEVENGRWEVLVKPGKKARIGENILFAKDFHCYVESVTDSGSRIVLFNSGTLDSANFTRMLAKYGEVPLPPYINATLSDKDRYQTVYSDSGKELSVAAPTAGLHFTEEIMSNLEEKGIDIAYVTLHVGLGTFRPVAVENILDHKMHKEYYLLTEENAAKIKKAKQNGNRVIAVGTTAVRVLETITSKNSGMLLADSGWTDIFIYPGYKFNCVSAIITNFHLPQSTLLMLVSAFAGTKNIMSLYECAIKERYRFFSFGDAMLLL